MPFRGFVVLEIWSGWGGGGFSISLYFSNLLSFSWVLLVFVYPCRYLKVFNVYHFICPGRIFCVVEDGGGNPCSPVHGFHPPPPLFQFYLLFLAGK